MTQELCRVVVTGAFEAGDIWQNTWYVDYDITNTPLIAADAEDIADQFETFYTTMAATFWSAGTSMEQVTVQDLNTDGQLPWSFSYAVTGPAVDTTPQICCVVCSLRNSGGSDPNERGRVYVPATGAGAWSANGFFGTSTRSVATAAVAALAGNLQTNTNSRGLVVFSRKLQSWLQVTQVVVDNVVGVQRGRQNDVLNKRDVQVVSFAE